MKKTYLNDFLYSISALLTAAVVLSALFPAYARAQETRTVRVAFFPMEGYHTYSESDGYGGMDVAYLEELCVYTGWDIEYVNCDSWDDALAKLEAKEVDLVGSAQYSDERSEIFDYAALPSGYTYGCLFVESGSNLAYEDFEAWWKVIFAKRNICSIWSGMESAILIFSNMTVHKNYRRRSQTERLMWLSTR